MRVLLFIAALYGAFVTLYAWNAACNVEALRMRCK